MRASSVVGSLVAGLLGTHAVAALAQPAAEAAAIRGDRPISVGFSPAWPWNSAHDVTVPLPAARLSVNISPRLSLDVTGGTLSYGAGGRWTLVDLGARWFLGDGHASPYLMVRGGEYWDKADEGRDAKLVYGAAGAGFEYACGCGFTTWGEVGPALLGYESGDPRVWNGGLYVSVGAGYRFGLRPRQ